MTYDEFRICKVSSPEKCFSGEEPGYEASLVPRPLSEKSRGSGNTAIQCLHANVYIRGQN